VEPVTMILSYMLQNPQQITKSIDSYKKPGQVDVAQLESSLADFAIQSLTCYHKTARFRGVDLIGSPWKEQSKYGAEGSIVMRINLTGVSGIPYQMIVAAMAKGNSYRTFVVAENTTISYNKNCQLERWTAASSQ
jgi:hypothetical protein